jgi:hypothetical protein
MGGTAPKDAAMEHISLTIRSFARAHGRRTRPLGRAGPARPARSGLAARLSGYWSGIAAALALAAMSSAPLPVHAIPVQYDLSFNTSGQSLWGSGESFTLNQSTFLGAAWQDKQAGIILMAGDEDTNVINPLRLAYDGAFGACRGLGFSSSACINGQSARAPVPRLGSRPSVRSCGAFAFACQTARLGDLAARAAYDIAFDGCRALGFSSTVCRNGQSARLPVVALGTAPAQYLEVDTRTGVALNATSDGRVGLELGVAIDSGSVDATVSYAALLEIPDTAGLDKANPISLNANSLLAGTNTLETSFSGLELSLDAIMELSGSVGAEACAIAAGCVAGATPFAIHERAPILSFNEDGEGGVLFLGQSPSDLGVSNPNADGFPFALNFAELSAYASGTLYLPQPDASGGLDSNGEKLTATGQDDLLDLFLDVDNIIASAAGVPGLFGSDFDIGLGSAGFDIIDVQMGPTIDLKQEFELDPTLFVSLDFDQAVQIGGELVTTLVSAWDLLPDITFLSDVTTVTPTFFVQADLTNRTLLDFDLEFLIDLLQVSFDFGLLGNGSFGIGNVLAQGIDLFDSPDLFNSLFALGGFNLQVGESFVIDFLLGPTAPSTAFVQSAVNEIVAQANPNAVSESDTALLLLLGLAGLYSSRRSLRHCAPRSALQPTRMA